MNKSEAQERFAAFKAATPGTHTIVWHVSPTGNRESIARSGLKPSDPNGGFFWTQANSTNHARGVYVSSDAPMVGSHPDNENKVVYGGDVYALRVPRAKLRHQAVSDEQFHEYVVGTVPKSDVIHIGHQSPYLNTRGNFSPSEDVNHEPHEFHWGHEDKCTTCANTWDLYEKESSQPAFLEAKEDWKAQRGDGFHAELKTGRQAPRR